MTRKFIVFVAVALFLLAATNVSAQYSRIADIVGTNHNMSSVSGPGTVKAVSNKQICFFCHVPHQMLNTTDPKVTRDPAGTVPLWNHLLSTKTYGVYSSPSFDAFGTDIAEVGSATPEGTSATVTNLCLSCHDGTVGINALYKGEYNSTTHTRNSPDFGAGINVWVTMGAGAQVGGTANGLRDEHPVNFTYNATLANASVSLVVPTPNGGGIGGARMGVTTSTGKFLPLFAQKMQCATCHDAHSQTNGRPFLRASTTGSEICLACHGK